MAMVLISIETELLHLLYDSVREIDSHSHNDLNVTIINSVL